jgi:hypothetical protein
VRRIEIILKMERERIKGRRWDGAGKEEGLGKWAMGDGKLEDEQGGREII